MAGVQPPSTHVHGTDTLYIYRYSIIVILLWPKCNFYMVYHHHHALIPAIICYDIHRTLTYISTQKISLKCIINTTTMHLNNISSSLDVDFSSFNKTLFRQTFIFILDTLLWFRHFLIFNHFNNDHRFIYFIISCFVGIVCSTKSNSTDQKHV